MSDSSSSTSGPWADAWMQMQRHYWDAWSDLTKRAADSGAPKKAAPDATSWTQGLDYWSKMIAPVIPSESRAWVDKILEMNQSYARMGELLWQAVSAGPDTGQNLTSWWEGVTRAVQEMQKKASSAAPAAGNESWNGFATLWGLPLDHWSRVTSACSLFPGDMSKALHDLNAARRSDALPDFLSGWLSTPTLGYTRESQEEVQRLGQCLLDYQKAMQDYSGVLSGVVARAAELLREKATERVGQGDAFESVRECYNLWVDCGEEAYAEICASDAFTRSQAAMTNALMALKRQEQSMIDEALSALNMPTRRELDTSHRRVHQLQRRVWKLEEALNASGIAELRAEMEALRTELAAVRSTAPAPASTRRAAKAKDET
ncbi:class III poly(R)-hydroxyalkanoic acid synthase subunit PhaE [Methylotetracoccus oryzae]|uniref:class III poly(R)-hydroxyalkanoic acid synthase subunit PhaE n=1 Tax=Methylotetracoccus oryzae TaxID=1919059 RepID=UPI001118B327|nr:class III poly(R)-hydroxyalkanoic acid synthase subunit PhaE [Methylotetracoccus oryzae]